MTTTRKVESPSFTTVTKVFTDKMIKSILVNAFEGGVGYWCRIDGYVLAEGLTLADFTDNRDKGGKIGKFCDPNDYYHPCQLVPLVPGCAVKLLDVTGESDGTTQEWKPGKDDYKGNDANRYLLTREKLISGVQKMADLKEGEGGHHWPNWLRGNDDSVTGDVFLQCCIFGKIIYG